MFNPQTILLQFPLYLSFLTAVNAAGGLWPEIQVSTYLHPTTCLPDGFCTDMKDFIQIRGTGFTGGRIFVDMRRYDQEDRDSMWRGSANGTWFNLKPGMVSCKPDEAGAKKAYVRAYDQNLEMYTATADIYVGCSDAKPSKK